MHRPLVLVLSLTLLGCATTQPVQPMLSPAVAPVTTARGRVECMPQSYAEDTHRAVHHRSTAVHPRTTAIGHRTGAPRSQRAHHSA